MEFLNRPAPVGLAELFFDSQKLVVIPPHDPITAAGPMRSRWGGAVRSWFTMNMGVSLFEGACGFKGNQKQKQITCLEGAPILRQTICLANGQSLFFEILRQLVGKLSN